MMPGVDEPPSDSMALPPVEESQGSKEFSEVSLSIDSLISTIKEEEGYPIGLKVLVVDEDPLFHQDLNKMLQKCQYTGTMCSSASEALPMLQDRSLKFDIILMAIQVNDIDGCKEIQRVAVQADLPIKYLLTKDASSFNAETLNDLLGANDSKLYKPICYRDVQCLWFPVAGKRKQNIRKLVKKEVIDGWEGSLISRLLYSRWGDDGSFRKLIKLIQEVEEEGEDNMNVKVEEHDISSYPNKKPKIQQGEDHMDAKVEDHYTSLFLIKKPKVPWRASDLHTEFLTAVYQLGIQNAVPAEILQRMNSPAGLTCKDVAIHLKEFRFLDENPASAHSSDMPFNEEKKSKRSRSRAGYIDDADLLQMCGGFYA